LTSSQPTVTRMILPLPNDPKLTAVNDRFRGMRFLLRLAPHGDDAIADYEVRTQAAKLSIHSRESGTKQGGP